MRISPRFCGLPEEEIARMVEEAQKSSEEDRRRQDEVEICIQAEVKSKTEALEKQVKIFQHLISRP